MIPPGIYGFYVELTDLNISQADTIVSGHHDNSVLIRSATVQSEARALVISLNKELKSVEYASFAMNVTNDHNVTRLLIFNITSAVDKTLLHAFAHLIENITLVNGTLSNTTTVNTTVSSSPSPGTGESTRKMMDIDLISTTRYNRIKKIQVPASPGWELLIERYRTEAPPALHPRDMLDTYGDSLKHVNKLFNYKFGKNSRKVPAHMPHMINVDVMKELQSLFSSEYNSTSSHQFRAKDDMQYSFAYMYYLIDVPRNDSVESMIQAYDTNNDKVLDDSELRNLIIDTTDLPLDDLDVLKFRYDVLNMTFPMPLSSTKTEGVDVLTFEIPDVPLTVDLIANNTNIRNKLKVFAKTQKKYR